MSSNPGSVEKNTSTDGLLERLVSVRRTAKVVKGGRVFGFSVLTVVGDGKGRIGIGRGKAREVPIAMQKSLQDARRNMGVFELNGTTVFHEIKGKHGATRVVIVPAAEGTGIIAGGAMRLLLEVGGVQNVLGKCIGSSNPINVVRATAKALQAMSSPHRTAQKRQKMLSEIWGAQHA